MEEKREKKTLEQEIDELEEEIEGYEKEYAETKNQEEKSELRGLITTRSKNLSVLQQIFLLQLQQTLLLQQQQLQPQGNFIFYFYFYYYFPLNLIFLLINIL